MKTPLDTVYDSAEDSPGLLLWQVTNKWQAQQRAALRAYDLTHVQFVLLASLVYAQNSEPFTQKQLAEHAQVDVMMASEVLRALESKRLVVRARHPQDKRAMIVTPTEAGTTLANRAVKVVEAVDRDFFGTLGSENMAHYMIMMRALLEHQA